MKMNLKIAFAAMFMAAGLALPFVTGQIPQIGKMLLPMHIPVFMCALVCGKWYGAAVGFILPFFRSLLIGMPALYPDAVVMAPELFTYAFVTGVIFETINNNTVTRIYMSMIPAMIAGRLVWGVWKFFVLGLGETSFTLEMFVTGGFLNAIPGIILQLVLVPVMTKLILTALSYQKVKL